MFENSQAFGSALLARGLKPNDSSFIGIYSVNRPEVNISTHLLIAGINLQFFVDSLFYRTLELYSAFLTFHIKSQKLKIASNKFQAFFCNFI